MGDRILSVNGVDIRKASHQDAVLALLSKKDSMHMTVQHDPLPSGFQVLIFMYRFQKLLLCEILVGQNFCLDLFSCFYIALTVF